MYAKFGGVWCRSVASGCCLPEAAKGERRARGSSAKLFVGGLGLCGSVARDARSVCMGSVGSVGLLWLLWDWTEALPTMGSGEQRELRRGVAAIQEAKEMCERHG